MYQWYCFICCVISTIISFKFRHTVIVEEKVKPISLKKYVKQLKDSSKFFIKSSRIQLLILLNAVFMGLIFGIVNLRSSMLSEMQVPEIYFGVIFALLQFSAAVTARNSERFHKALRNKVLGFLTIPVTVSCILIGFVGGDTLSKSSLMLIFLLYLVQYAFKGPYNALMCSLLLEFTTTANTFIIIGCITTIVAVLLLDRMRTRVGLKPSQYTKEDLKYSQLKK